jgi:ribosomal-protein-alanine N-acetyltransferase
MSDSFIFSTPNLFIRKAKPIDKDVDLLFNLWTSPKVMAFVGFPYGLNITRDKVLEKIANQSPSEFNSLLIAELKESLRLIGECRLGLPDSEGVAFTDIKLLPEFWGKGFGTEIKRGLLDYLFFHTNCLAVRATPNRLNIASQKMQSAVGGKKCGEGIYHFPNDMSDHTTDISYIEYRVNRRDWGNDRALTP